MTPTSELIARDAVFDGPDLTKADVVRLSGQIQRVYDALITGRWFTLSELAKEVGGSEAGVSARLRDLRKPRFGGYTIQRRRIDGRALYEYAMELPQFLKGQP